MFHFTRFEFQSSPSTNIPTHLKKYAIRVAAFLGTLLLAACGTWIPDNFPDGDLQGVATVEWASEDLFIYRPGDKPLTFQPSFWKHTAKLIAPRKPMYTDGGSIPRFFWNIPGLSPWGFGPAYVIHDYIFLVHRCGLDDPDVASITFPQSAEVLAEVGKSLVDLGLIKHDALDIIVWGVKTQYAETLWNTPGDPVKDCTPPPTSLLGGPVVARFDVSAIRRQMLRAQRLR
jgi:hypothetical protein